MIWSESLLNQLLERGWGYDDAVLDRGLGARWQKLFEKKQSSALFRQSHIAQHRTRLDIRSDQICWLDGKNHEDHDVLQTLEESRRVAQEDLRVSFPEIEAHFAHYPRGSSYGRHCDQPQGQGSRRLTFVVYLHHEWQPGWGGELVITDGDCDRPLEIIEPKPLRVVFFKSDEVWHEVRKSNFDRHSLTGWFRHGRTLLSDRKTDSF
ncbi:MAG: 2OG-Fe(II) oxygenase [Bdellovibrionales bacterium]